MHLRDNISQIISWLAAVLIAVVVFGLPAGYYWTARENMAGSLESEAEINARIITQVVSQNPNLWEFESVRLEEYLKRRPRQGMPESRRVYNAKSELIVASDDYLTRPLISQTVALYDSGTPVGSMVITRSLAPILQRVGLLLLCLIPLGLGMFLLLRSYPIRMLRQAEMALRQSEKTYRSLMETAGDAIFIFDATTETIRDLNLKAERLLDLRARDIIGKPQSLIFPEGDAQSASATLRCLTQSSREATNEVQLRRSDGMFIPVEVSAGMIKIGNQYLIHGIFRDISERKAAESRHEKLRERLERAQRMESLGLLAGGVAHDLNNTLGPLVAYPEMILEELSPDNPLYHDVEVMGRAAQQAADTIQDLLTLARRGRYEMTPTNLNDVVREYLESPSYSSLTARHRAAKVDLHLANNLPNIMGSASHLSKVIMNLVVNAFDAMPDSGTLTIQTDCGFLDRISTERVKIEKGDYVRLIVRDTGIGIDSSDQEHMFEPYFSKKKMGRSGSGLGLSVVYGILKDHKGYYDVFSEVGKGTEIVLYFPVTSVIVQKVSEPAVSYTGTESVLVVDDVSEQRDVASSLLSSLGYKVSSVTGGREAVAFLSVNAVDLVVLDMIMEHDFDGLTTYLEISKIRPGQKAVIVTGFSATERVNRMLELGAGACVRKPYTRDALGKAVREELDRKSAPAMA